jgi:hypothetical protein
VTAGNNDLRVDITGSSVKGNVDVSRALNALGVAQIHIADTRVDGSLIAGGTTDADFDRLSVHGGFQLQDWRGLKPWNVRHSYLYSTSSPALRLANANVDLETSFVQGGTQWATVHFVSGGFHALSSVLAGYVYREAIAPNPRCTDTYGADYELLTALCERLPP